MLVLQPWGSTAKTVSTIAALKALISHANNDQVQVAGYYSPGDGGGGIFYYDASSSATDNGGTVIAPTAGAGRWKRIYSGAVNVKWFGAKGGDGAADDTTAIQNTINSISNTSSLGRAGGSRIYFPDGDYTITSSLIIDNSNIEILGNKSRILYAGSGPAIDVGNSDYLTNLSAGYYIFRAEKIAIVLSNSTGAGIRNRGYRRVQLAQCYVTGGLIGFESEGGWGGSYIENSIFQSQSGLGSRGVLIKQRNNLLQLKKVAVLSGAEVGYQITTSSAETKGVLFENCDAEGCATGYQLDGSNISSITFLNCWGESNSVMDIQVNNVTGTNKYAVGVIGGVFSKGITIGNNGQSGDISGFMVGGVEFSGGIGLDIWVQNGVTVGTNRFGGSSALTYSGGQGYGGSRTPSANVMSRYSSPTIPTTSQQGGNILGDIRWSGNRLFVSTGNSNPFWQTAQLEAFNGPTDPIPTLEASTTPTASGVGSAITTNSAYAITDFPNGFTGQRITIVGSSAGLTSIVHGANIRLPGGSNITLGEYDSVTLLCRRASPSLWVCTSYTNNG